MIKRLIPILLLLLMASFAFSQCSSTSYNNGVTCIQVQANAGSTNLTTRNVNISPTAGHQLVVTGYWCHQDAGHDCLQSGTETVTMSTTGGTCTWTAAPHSPYYLQETGNQWTGGFTFMCPNTGSGITQVQANFSAAVDYPTIAAIEFTGLATSAPLFDSDAGCFSTSSGTTFTCNFATNLSYTNDLLLGAITTPSDFVVTYSYPASSKTIISQDGFGGTIGGLTISAAGSQHMAGSWSPADNYTGPLMAIRSAASVLATVPNQFPRTY